MREWCVEKRRRVEVSKKHALFVAATQQQQEYTTSICCTTGDGRAAHRGKGNRRMGHGDHASTSTPALTVVSPCWASSINGTLL